MPFDAQGVTQILRQLVITRFEGRSVRGLCELDPSLWRVEPAVVSALFESRHEIGALLDPDGAAGSVERVKFLTTQMVRYLHTRNQFLELDGDALLMLARVYERFAQRVRTAMAEADTEAGLQSALHDALREYQARLGAFLVTLDPDGPAHGMVFREVQCAEYAATLQVRVLNLDLDSLLDPILDLGCGETAGLVRYLRAKGREAFGVDRIAPAEDFILGKDWLALTLEPGAWGTVISHLGLSNHFLHHHLRPGGQAERYAHKYMEILRALKPGGSFIYSPGLPFMETLLSRDTYSIWKVPVPRVAGSVYDGELSSVFGASVCYACHIQRVGG